MHVLYFILVATGYAYCSLLLYFRHFWKRVPVFAQAHHQASELPSLTVVIPARNEEANIAACLHTVLACTYNGQRTIVVVDDFSTDATPHIVRGFAGVELVMLQQHVTPGTTAYKKKAIETAINLFPADVIVCTDADCTVPPQWLDNIGKAWQQTQFHFLAMPVSIKRSPGFHFLEIFQSLDLMTYQGLSAAAIAAHKPLLCNGANLAYSREAFVAVDGFAGIDDIASGDDVLLMHKMQARFPGKVFFLKNDNVIVQTLAMPTVSTLLAQRIRWGGKAKHYQNKTVTVTAALVWLFNLLLLVLPLLLLVWPMPYLRVGRASFSGWEVWLGMVALKVVVELIYMVPVARFFGKQSELKWFLLAQPLHIFYTACAGLLGLVGGTHWKGRRIR